ncbi:hypothetical protein M569_07566, partial [Genlisea aurea]
NTRFCCGAVMASTVPSCENKCGHCKPCEAVVWRVPPAKSGGGDEDYYPVVWGCSCRGELYHP